MPKLIFFDLDGTLAESKQPLTAEMAELVAKLLERTKVAVISGGALPQFLAQVVEQLPSGAHLPELYILPTSGAALFEYQQTTWHKVYEEHLTEAEREQIEKAMREAAVETKIIDMRAESYGELIEYRGGQVSFSALGQRAPIALKKAWDPDKVKRARLQEVIASKLPGYTVAMGGSTTIDVTKHGIDKAYGIHQLCERLHLSEHDVLYVGDELIRGGNDEAVFRTNAQVRSVATPQETKRVILELLSA